MKGRYKLSWLCEALMVSRSGYYDWIRRREVPGKRAAQNAVLRARIEQEFTRSRQTYGSHRIVRALGGGVSRNRVARIMREQPCGPASAPSTGCARLTAATAIRLR
jgi:putative transposase